MKPKPILICFLSAWSLTVLAAGTACFTAKVVDESGKPLQGVAVVGGFYQKTPLRGLTDNNGEFPMKNDGVIFWEAGFNANATGCYESHAGYTFNPVIVGGKWQPWNPVVTAVVRRIVNPIPMYAKQIRSVIPILDQFVGYDLAKGDWVTPYGKGVVSDFNFRMRKRFVDIRNFDSSLELVLTNAVDGLNGVILSSIPNSEYRLPRSAPLEGYAQKFTVSESSTNYFKPNDDQSYLFRVRSVTNAEGKILSAQYGKIRGYIGFDVRRHPTGIVSFTYYLNPTPNDRNMEFNPKQNLLKDIKSTEEVRYP